MSDRQHSVKNPSILCLRTDSRGRARRRGRRFDFPPQVEDVRIHRAIGDRYTDAPRGVDQLRAAQDPPAIPNQRGKQPQFLGCDLHRASQFRRIEIDGAIPESVGARLRALGSPQVGAYSSPEFAPGAIPCSCRHFPHSTLRRLLGIGYFLPSHFASFALALGACRPARTRESSVSSARPGTAVWVIKALAMCNASSVRIGSTGNGRLARLTTSAPTLSMC